MIPKEVFAAYEPTIGIECHVQFNTVTKLFSGADNDERGKQPNTAVSPLCFGLPGTLPVLNEKAVELAIKAGLAMNAKIAPISAFDRKHYFYPDLPKGYQITQLYHPVVLNGYINAPLPNGDVKKVRIHHAHLEEDAGKSTHPAGADYSLVDLNRAGTPLLEIVSEPDMHSAAEAKAFVQELYLLMKYARVTHGDLQHGNMRFDVNISVAKKGAPWGTRVEVKNLNSFRAVERAVEFEFKRHIELLEKGQSVTQETRGWVEATQKTVSQRSKEQAMDYRYFPEPDIPPLHISEQHVQAIAAAMPQLPAALRTQIKARGIDTDVANTLILRDALHGTSYVRTVLSVNIAAAPFTAHYIANRDIAFVEGAVKEGKHVGVLPSADAFNIVFEMRAAGELSSNNADALLLALRQSPQSQPKDVASELGFLQTNDDEALSSIITEVLARPECQKAAADVANGELKAIGFLVGQVMKASQGKANPAKVGDLIRRQLGV